MNDNSSIKKTKVYRVKIDVDAGIAFEKQCKNEGTNVNAKLKESIDFSLKGQKRYFHAGKNKIVYDQAHNLFSWKVLIDTEKLVEVTKNLSDEFLRNLRQEIDKALQERDDWIHNRQSDSVPIPTELLGDKI